MKIGGNYQDILQMCYWDYLTILQTIRRQAAEAKGEPFLLVQGELPEHSKAMIERRKKYDRR